jgi:hypothetical protein
MRLDTSIRMLVVGAMAMTPAVAGAQTGATSSPLTRPWFEGSVGASIGSHVRATSAPICDDLGQLCVPIAPSVSVGGNLSLGGRISDRVSIMARMDTYTQKWNTLEGAAHREYVRYLMAGPRFYAPLGPASARTRFVGEMLFGIVQRELVGVSDPVAEHGAFEASAGVDWRFSKDLASPSIRATVRRVHAGDVASGLSEWRGSVELHMRFGTLAPVLPRSNPDPYARPWVMPVPAAGDRIEIAPAITLQTPPDVNLPPRCEALGLPCGTPRTFPDLGVTLSGGAHVSDLLSVVGELSAYANLWHSSAAPDGEEINHVRAALGGVRFRTPPLWTGGQTPFAMRLFAQVLAGSESSSVTTRHSAIQPGMGADFYAGLFTLRCQMDYRFVPTGERNLSAARFLVGLVFAR